MMNTELTYKDLRKLKFQMNELATGGGSGNALADDNTRKRWKYLCSYDKCWAETESLDIVCGGNVVILRPFTTESFKRKSKIITGKGLGIDTGIYQEHPSQGIVVGIGTGHLLDNGIRRYSEYGLWSHVFVDDERMAMAQRLLYRGVIYFRLQSSMILCSVNRSYSIELEGLEFVTR